MRYGAKRIGTHFIADLSSCRHNYVEYAPLLQLAMKACRDAQMTPLDFAAATVSNGITSGASAVVLLKESHVAIHTWPELGYAAVDLFTCGPEEAGREAFEKVCGAFDVPGLEILEIERKVKK